MKRWFIYSVLAGFLLLVIATILVLTTEWGLSVVLASAVLFVPGQLVIAGHSGDLLGPLMLDGIEYRYADTEIAINRLELDWRPRRLVAGELQITQLQIKDGKLTYHAPQIAEPKTTDKTSVDFSLPVNISIDAATLDNIQVMTGAEQTPVVVNLLKFKAQAEDQHVNVENLYAAAYDTEIKTSGSIRLTELLPMQLQLQANYQYASNQQLQSEGSITGDLKKLEIDQQLSGPIEAKLAIKGYDLADNLHWDATIDQARLKLSELDQALPAAHVSANANVSGDTSTVALQATIQFEDKALGDASFSLTAQSELSTLIYDFMLQGDFVGVEVPAGRLQLTGKGDTQGLVLSKIDIQMLQGTIQGDARVQWLPALSMTGDLKVKNIQTATLSAQWPGKVSANINVTTEQRSATSRYRVQITGLEGVLRDYPFQGMARGSWQPDEIAIDALKLSVAKSSLSLQGSVTDRWNLQFSVQSPDLQQVLPEAQGSLDLAGTLTGVRAEPELSLMGRGDELGYQTDTIKSLSMQIQTGLAANANMQIAIEAANVDSSYGHWAQASLTGTGTNSAHTLMLNLMNDASSHIATLSGQFRPWQWQGQLTQLDLAEQALGAWHLQRPVQLQIQQDRIQFSELCLLQTPAQVCAEMRWLHERKSAKMTGNMLPLSLLKFWLPQNIQMTGAVDFHSELAGEDSQYAGELKITAADNAVSVNFPDINESVVLAASEISVQLNSKGLEGKIYLPLQAGGGVEGEVQLQNWSVQQPLARNQALHARVVLDQLPADTFTRFVPDMVRAQGYLQSDLLLSGTLGEPQMRGKIEWLDGNMILPELGIKVTDIRADAHSQQSNKIEFTISGRSGEGKVELAGETQLDPAQGWPTQVTLRSQRLEVINIPEAYILIDSDLRAALQGSTITIEGDITVPRARLRPRALPEGSAGLSRDAVIVTEGETNDTARWRVSSRVRVNLGELVDFDGFGVSGKLKGSLLLIDEPGKLVLGRGEVSIQDGIYRLRGQDLQIRQGRLIFTDTFIDDPGIDVDAIRKIETVTVGVRLKGTLRQPQLSIFSEPAMPETEALTYLILGHSPNTATASEEESMRNNAAAMGFFAGDVLSQEIGGRLGLDEMRVDVGETAEKTSLVMGKYLSPKLYVRYFSGLVESSSIVQLRYQLSDRIEVQTEGGYRGSQSITGGDIFFTIQY